MNQSVCLGTKLFFNLRHQIPNLNQFAKNASTSISYLLPIGKHRLPRRKPYHYQGRRSAHCKRENPCEKKKKIDKEKKELKKKKLSGFWSTLFAPKKKKPPIETCRYLRAMHQFEEEKIPEFIEEMCKGLPGGSCIYKTKGHAFILEVPCKKSCIPEKTRPERLVAKIERDKQCCEIEDEANPVPHFSSCAQRLLDLQERKLHPLYKKLEEPLNPRVKPYDLVTKYQCLAPGTDKSKWDYFCHKRKKNLFSEVKMAVLPTYLENKAKIIELNTYSQLESKPECFKKCKTVGKYHFQECPNLDCEEYHRKRAIKLKKFENPEDKKPSNCKELIDKMEANAKKQEKDEF